jgi:hypothetical protein
MLLKYGKFFHPSQPYISGKRMILIHTQQFRNVLNTSNTFVSNNFFFSKTFHSKTQKLTKHPITSNDFNVMNKYAKKKFLKNFLYLIGTLGFAAGVFYNPKNTNHGIT